MLDIIIILFLIFAICFDLYVLRLIDEVIALLQYLYGSDENE
ncbi:MAG: hypothetical protein ACI31M_01065 [Bacilli bacterium]